MSTGKILRRSGLALLLMFIVFLLALLFDL